MANQLLDLRQAKTAALDKAGVLLATVGNRGMTDDEQAQYDGFFTEAEGVQRTIEAHERLQAVVPDVATANPHSAVRPGTQPVTVHENLLDKPWVPAAPTGETKEGRFRRMSHSFGQFLSEVRTAELKQKQGEKGDVRLYASRDDFQRRAAAAGSSEMVPSDGGFLIAPDFIQEILMVAHEVGLIHPRCRKLPLSEFTNAVKIPAIDEQSRKDGSRWGGVQMFWENEAVSLVGSKPTFAALEMITKKLTGLYYATNEVLADARLLGAVVMQAFSEEFAFKLDDGVIRGTGAGQMSGILGANCLISVSAETGQATKTIVFENIKKMWGRMWARSRANAVWLVNQDTEQQLFGLAQVVGTGGVPVYLPPGAGTFGGAQGAPLVGAPAGGTLFGRPVIVAEHPATLGTVGDIILADFQQYLTIDKGDLQTATSVHVRFLTDEMTYRWIYRTDGQPWWKTAITPFQGTSTLSPFVVLATR